MPQNNPTKRRYIGFAVSFILLVYICRNLLLKPPQPPVDTYLPSLAGRYRSGQHLPHALPHPASYLRRVSQTKSVATHGSRGYIPLLSPSRHTLALITIYVTVEDITYFTKQGWFYNFLALKWCWRFQISLVMFEISNILRDVWNFKYCNSYNVPVVYMGRDVWIWMGGVIHSEGRLKGWALKSRLFWALKLQQAQRVPFGPKKVEVAWFFSISSSFIMLGQWQSLEFTQYGLGGFHLGTFT
jgi:hypothetical protein